MSYLLDTTILSELRKPAARRNEGLVRWLSEVRSDELYLSVLVIGEIRKGIEQVRGPYPQQAGALDAWLTQIETFYADRIVPVTTPIAVRWGGAPRQGATIRSSTVSWLRRQTSTACSWSHATFRIWSNGRRSIRT